MISAIVTTYMRLDCLKEWWEGFQKAVNSDQRARMRIIVVDNGRDESTEWCYKQGLFCITPSHNLGHMGAINLVMKLEGDTLGDRVLLMDNDTVPTPGFLEPMMEMADRGYDVVGARLLFPDGRLQHCGIGFGLNHLPFMPLLGSAGDTPPALVDRPCPAATFACVLMDRKMMESVGEMDEKFFTTHGDVDYCLRAKELGFRIGYSARSVVYHKMWQAPGRLENIKEQTAYFKQKWLDAGRIYPVLGVWPIIL